jgi:hypothetical protein
MKRAAFALLVCCGPVLAQDYRPVSEKIDGARVARLEADAAGQNADVRSTLAETLAALDSYYSQFIADKRIQDERRRPGLSVETLSENSVRLIQQARAREFGRGFFLGDHPFLYRLHRTAAVLYLRLDDPVRALNEYSMAFRYASVDPPYKDQPEDKKAVYLRMAQMFADPARIQEESDPAFKAAAERVRPLIEQYLKSLNDLEKAERSIAVEEARAVRGQAANPAGARAARDRLKTQVEGLEAGLEEIRKGDYKRYALSVQRKNGELCLEMAKIVRVLELKNKEVDRILNRSSYYRGVGDEPEENRTAYSGFTGYGILLELANRIDPENTTYISLLAEEYRRTRKLELAVEFYERYFQLAERDAAAAQSQQTTDNMRRLAGIFTDQKNYIRAAQMLESFVARSPEIDARLQLADIHFYRTGKIDRALELYNEYLQRRPAPGNDVKSRTEAALLEFRIQGNLAAIARRSLYSDRERAALLRAEETYQRVAAEHAAALKAEEGVRAQLFEIKRKLLTREDEDLQRDYYRMQRIELAEAVELSGYLHTRKDTMRIGPVLERLAYLAEKGRDYDLARTKYADVIQLGTGPEQTRARENLERIRLTLQDGLIRPPSVPPDFER